MPKQVGNTVLAFLLILFPRSVMRSGLNFSFSTMLMILLLLLWACLYGHINWSLAQAHQKYSLGLSQSLASMRCVKAKPKARFILHVWNQPVPVSGGAFWAQKHHLDTRTESPKGGRKSAGGASTSSTYPKKKGHHGG